MHSGGSPQQASTHNTVGSSPPAPAPAAPPGAALAQTHYENFPVASLLCPPALRPAITAIYGYARTADDIADEGDALPAQRLADLAAYQRDLLACAAGQPPSPRWAPVFGALAPVITGFKLPLPLLCDLLSAFSQDVVKTRYASQLELLDYCRRSANPVGRLLMHLYAIDDDDALAQSDCICSALQLINFWQDLSIDIPRGRIYLPADSWLEYGVTEADLLARHINPATTALVRQHVEAAQALMQRGAPLCLRVPGRAGWELRLVVQGGLRIAEKIERLGFATLQQRPKLTAWDTCVMVWRAVSRF